MIKQYEDQSLKYGKPGAILFLLLPPVGLILIIIALSYYIQAKKQNPLYNLLSLIPIIGWIMIGLLPDLDKS